MDARVKPAPNEIRLARAENPKMRERDLAAQLGVSEAELVAAHCGDGVLRIEPRVNDVLTGLEAVGEVMALTRNESAVHEKIGVYDKVVTGKHNAMVLGEQIDLRIFPKVWAHGFAVEKRDGDEIRRSLQFFDASGEAVHKVHLRAGSSLYAYQKLVTALASADQRQTVDIETLDDDAQPQASDAGASVDDLRERWSRLTDVHQFFGLLKALKLSRQQAVRMVGQDYAWMLDPDALGAMLHHVGSWRDPDHVLRRKPWLHPDPFRAGQGHQADGSVDQHPRRDLQPASEARPRPRAMGGPQADQRWPCHLARSL